MTAQWGGHAMGGYIAPHRPEMQHLVQGHSAAFAIHYFKPTDGKKEWHQAYNFPSYGAEAAMSFTGNTKQLGTQYSAAFILKLPLNRKKDSVNTNTFKHYLNLGIGAGYATKIWDLTENNKSLVLGSHLNASIILHYEIALYTATKWQLLAGFRMHHLSNGAFQLPNLGTNNMLLSLGLRHLEPIQKQEPSNTNTFTKSWKTSINLIGGLKEISPPTGKKYASYTLSVLQEKHFSFKSAFGIGADYMMNSAVKALRNRFETRTYNSFQSSQLGMVLSYGMYFNEFQFKIQQGVYLVNAYSGDGALYHRITLKYPIYKNVFASLGLKTHFAKADHTEIGLTYQL